MKYNNSGGVVTVVSLRSDADVVITRPVEFGKEAEPECCI
jgi:hypothetical protein